MREGTLKPPLRVRALKHCEPVWIYWRIKTFSSPSLKLGVKSKKYGGLFRLWVVYIRVNAGSFTPGCSPAPSRVERLTLQQRPFSRLVPPTKCCSELETRRELKREKVREGGGGGRRTKRQTRCVFCLDLNEAERKGVGVRRLAYKEE